MTDDDFDWERHTGDTPSLETGPMYDHSKGFRGGGMCICWFTKHVNKNKDEPGGMLRNFLLYNLSSGLGRESRIARTQRNKARRAKLALDLTLACMFAFSQVITCTWRLLRREKMAT